jgi:hypothetical protein
LKLKKGKLKEITEFCPLDLFSGDFERVRKAVNDLMKIPHSYLRIFGDPVDSLVDLLPVILVEDGVLQLLKKVQMELRMKQDEMSYLLNMGFKDVSLMIRINPTPGHPSQVVKFKQKDVLFEIKVIDFDFKAEEKMEYYRQLELEIEQYSSGEPCKE